MKLRLTALGITLAAVAGGGLVAGHPAQGASTKVIKVIDNRFSPKRGSVKKGTTLLFKWEGQNSHNVVVSGAAKGVSKVQRTGTLTIHANKTGTIHFVCNIHPGMKGSIKVT